MNWIEWLAVWVIAGAIATPFIGEYLHNRRINREWNDFLDKEQKARADAWLSDEEMAYLASIGGQPMLLISEDDYHAWLADEDEQPHLPRAS